MEKILSCFIDEAGDSLFNALFHFTRKLDLSYVCPRVDKRILPVCDDVTITYKLFKVADLLCTMELIKEKADRNCICFK